MKRNLLPILTAFLLIFGVFLVQAIILDDSEKSFVQEGDNYPPLRENIENSYFHFETQTQNIIYPSLDEFKESEYSGYIIEFEKPSIIEKRGELQKVAETNKNFFLANIPIISEFFVTYNNLEPRVQRYERELDTENQKIKNEIFNKVPSITGNAISEPEEKILNEFSLVFNGIALNVSDEEAMQIEKIKGIKKAWPNYKVEALLSESVPLIQDGIPSGRIGINGEDIVDYCHQFDPAYLRFDPAYLRSDQEYPSSDLECDADPLCRWNDYDSWCEPKPESYLAGKGVKIAIIDTGVDYTHPDLGGCLGINCKVIGGYDIVNNDADPMDDNGHGTHVAATAAGNGVLKGVAPDAQILAYKVLDSYGSGYWDEVIKGIERAVADNAGIISMSLGADGGNPDDPLSQAVDNAVDTGIVAVIAAGNSGPYENTIGSPGTARKAITVGATDKYDNLARFSSRGSVVWNDKNGKQKIISKPDVVAPGLNICAAQASNNWLSERECLDSQHISISGTSMATPHVAGAVALLKQKHPDWSPEEIKAALKGTAKNLGLSLAGQGAGRINVKQAGKSEEKPLIVSFNELDYKVSGIIDITGTVKGEGFENYEVYYFNKEGASGIICTGINQINNDILCKNFDTSNLKDGSYEIKVIAYTDKKNYVGYNILNIKNFEITSPINNTLFSKGEIGIVEIKGTVYHKDFLNYKILIDGVIPPKTRVSLQNEGTKTVINNTLGYWNISDVDVSGEFPLSIQVELNNGTFYNIPSQTIFVDPFLKKLNYTRGSVNYPAIAADILGDSKEELIFVTSFDLGEYSSSKLHVFDSEGQYVGGYPKDLENDGSFFYNNWWSAPALGDLNNDGKLDITFQGVKKWDFFTGGVFYQGSENLVTVLYSDGSEKRLPLPEISGRPGPSPVIADLDNDGNLEIIYSFDKLLIFDNNLNPVTSYLEGGNEFVSSAPAVADLNNDGNLEIIATTYNTSSKQMFLHALKIDGSDYFPPINLNCGSGCSGLIKYPPSSVVIGDIDNDGKYDIVVHYPYYLVVFDSNGFIKKPWPVRLKLDEIYSPQFYSLADLNNDGNLEIIGSELGGYDGTSGKFKPGNIYVYNYQGQILSGWEDKNAPSFLSPLIAGDVTGDGSVDIITGTTFKTDYLHIFDMDGNIIYRDVIVNQINGVFGSLFSTPLAGDFNRDGKVDLFFIGATQILPSECDICGGIYLWNLPASYDPNKMPWPMFMHDAQHTNCYNCTKISVPANISKIENLGNNEVSINLSIKIQKFEENTWKDYVEIIKGNYTIYAHQALDLVSLFNNQDVTISQEGRYRINTTVTDFYGKFITDSIKAFNVTSS